MKMHLGKPGTDKTLCGQLAGFEITGTTITLDDEVMCGTCARISRSTDATTGGSGS